MRREINHPQIDEGFPFGAELNANLDSESEDINENGTEAENSAMMNQGSNSEAKKWRKKSI
jgi:hypothetical protein